MRRASSTRGTGVRLTLTQQVALLSAVPMLVLGFALAHVLQAQILGRTLAEETRAARLIAHIGIQPELTRREVSEGLDPAQIRDLDRQLRTAAVKHDLARIKIWNAHHTVIYSDDHSLIGRTLEPSDDLEAALAGHPQEAAIVNPRPHTETAGEVGLGTLIEVYVPLRFSARGLPAGAFEMYLSYRPVAGAITRDHREIAFLLAGGLLLLWLVLYRIVAGASRRLLAQAVENDRLARYDRLTGLANRTLFNERLEGALQAHESAPAVLLADVEGFKEINNTLGNDTGDKVLRSVARRLDGGLDGVALVARIGNDEFAMLCDQLPAGGAEAVARAVQRELEAPLVLNGVALNIELSIGIADTEASNGRAPELVQHAEAALARARATGSGIERYSAERDRFDPERLRLLGEVRRALEQHEFVVHYQPKLDLKTRAATGVEALVRWQHPEKGLLPPVQFVPLVEQTALIGPLTEAVVSRAIEDLARWRSTGLDLDVAINLSARSLLDAGLPAQILAIAGRHGVPPERITVEVTESATMTDPDLAIAALGELRAAGVGVSIDDYGTGNASIDYLARLPASEIKIDKRFIADICTDARADAVVRSTIQIARQLELKVVAEGIETDEVLEHVSALGCDAAQGFLMARPLPEEQLLGKLAVLNEGIAAKAQRKPAAKKPAAKAQPKPAAKAKPTPGGEIKVRRGTRAARAS